MIVSSEHSGPAEVVATQRVVYPNSGFPDPFTPFLLSIRVGEKNIAG